MTVFVDTSALFALLDADDERHREAAMVFATLAGSADLVTHNYVHVESIALTARRLGPLATRALLDDLLPSVRTVWVDKALHAAALAAYREGSSASLVDHVSFELMREAGITVAFAFDADFAARGFARATAEGRGPQRAGEAAAAYRSTVPERPADLVSVSEIAARTGRSVHTVQSWRRRYRDFPKPLVQLAAGPVWAWPAVSEWIASRA